MPNFKVFSEIPTELLAQVSQPTAASLLSQVSNATAASLLSQVSNATAASLLSQVSNATAASLLSEVSNATAASLLSQVSNATAASLLSQVSNATAASLLAQVSNLTPASLLAQVSNLTAACLVVQIANLTAASLVVQTTPTTTEVETDVASTGDTTFKAAVTQNVLAYDKVTFTVKNSGTNTAVVRLQLSADSVLFTNDTGAATQTVAPSSQIFFVPAVFTKYAQVQYSSQTGTLPTSLSIFWNAQT